VQNGLRFGVGEDDGGFVVYVRVNVRFDLLRDRCDPKWPLAVHEPGHQIGAIAPEIEERARAVEFWIGEPFQEFGTDVDFFRTFVTVVDDDLADIPDCAGMDEIVRGMVTGVPGSFVINENLNFCGAGGAGNGLRVFVRDGQRFFHHYGNGIASAEFSNFSVIVGGGVNEDRLRVRGAKKFVKIGVVEGRIQVKLRCVSIEKSAVGFGDGNDLDVGAVERVGEKSLGMAVNEAGNGDAERRLGVGGGNCLSRNQRQTDNQGYGKQQTRHRSSGKNRKDDITSPVQERSPTTLGERPQVPRKPVSRQVKTPAVLQMVAQAGEEFAERVAIVLDDDNTHGEGG